MEGSGIEAQPGKMSESRHLEVVLVPGTWARGLPFIRLFFPGKQPWFDRQSKFTQTLMQTGEECGFSTKIYVFEWSGENSICARAEASERLAAQIEKTSGLV